MLQRYLLFNDVRSFATEVTLGWLLLNNTVSQVTRSSRPSLFFQSWDWHCQKARSGMVWRFWSRIQQQLTLDRNQNWDYATCASLILIRRIKGFKKVCKWLLFIKLDKRDEY